MLLCLLNSLATTHLTTHLVVMGSVIAGVVVGGGVAKRFIFLRCGLTASPYLTLKIKKAIYELNAV